MTPQLILTLSPSGQLLVELPGPAGRRQVQLADEPQKAIAAIHRMLQAQMREAQAVGRDSAPTQAQVVHWQRHCSGEPLFSDPSCVFCIDEGRFERSEKAQLRAMAKVSRQQRERLLVAGSGPDAVEIRHKPGYRTKLVTVRDEWDGLPQLMLRAEAKERGLKPLASEQRTSLGLEDLGLE